MTVENRELSIPNIVVLNKKEGASMDKLKNDFKIRAPTNLPLLQGRPAYLDTKTENPGQST
jgi:hypothetical protein